MANNNKDFSFSHRGNNAVLAYQVGKHIYVARVRVPKYSAEFGVTATESHARDHRAFYPHRRIHGKFYVTVECMGYDEFKEFMRWLINYAHHLLYTHNSKVAMPMHFSMPSREVNRLGILLNGLSDHDNIGSMVFTVPLEFITISVPNDPAIPLLYPQDTSEFKSPRVDPNISKAFYPVTGNAIVDSNIYDNLNKIDPSQIPIPYPPVTGGPGIRFPT